MRKDGQKGKSFYVTKEYSRLTRFSQRDQRLYTFFRHGHVIHKDAWIHIGIFLELEDDTKS